MLFANVCAWFISSCYGECCFFCFLFCVLVSSWRLVHMGSIGLAGLPVVYKTWVTQVCLLGALPL